MYGVTAPTNLMGEVEIVPHVIIRVDAMHAITRNKLTAAVKSMCNVHGWQSKTTQILNTLERVLPVPRTPMPAKMYGILKGRGLLLEVKAKLALVNVKIDKGYNGYMFFSPLNPNRHPMVYNGYRSSTEKAAEVLAPYRDEIGFEELLSPSDFKAREIILNALETRRPFEVHGTTIRIL